jgi:hypothetical protein
VRRVRDEKDLPDYIMPTTKSAQEKVMLKRFVAAVHNEDHKTNIVYSKNNIVNNSRL